ncbi:MAG: ActS/PrrB/RegB family redox-sensitive histidine kinase [Pseudomonadota bacterium]
MTDATSDPTAAQGLRGHTAASEADGGAEPAPIFEPGARALRSETLVVLRWVTTAVQTTAVLAAALLFGAQIPLAACLAVVAAPAALNLWLMTVANRSERLGDAKAAATLSFDVAVTAALVQLTGGLANPFALALIAPVTIAASAATLRATLIVAGAAAAAASALWALADPAPTAAPAIWAALLLGILLQAIYARRIAVEGRDLSDALAATQLALEQERRLSAIGALAAQAAHELGTPLATIKLVAGELRRELRNWPELQDDADLISQQAARCRDILTKLSSEPGEASALPTAPLSAVVEEAARPHLDRRATVILRVNGAPAHGGGEEPAAARSRARARAQPSVSRRPEVIHGLRNLIQNAVDFAATTVLVDIRFTEDSVTVVIRDDGAGFSPEILSRLGEPFATTRGKFAADRRAADGYQGMGLGVFISKTLLERTGARLAFYNARAKPSAAPPLGAAGDGHALREGAPARDDAAALEAEEEALSALAASGDGAVAEIAWPRRAIEAAPR